MNDTPLDQANSTKAIYERLTAIFREVFGNPAIVLKPGTNAADIEGWDSFATVSLIAAIEQEFGIQVRTAEIQVLRDVASFSEMICAKLEARA